MQVRQRAAVINGECALCKRIYLVKTLKSFYLVIFSSFILKRPNVALSLGLAVLILYRFAVFVILGLLEPEALRLIIFVEIMLVVRINACGNGICIAVLEVSAVRIIVIIAYEVAVLSALSIYIYVHIALVALESNVNALERINSFSLIKTLYLYLKLGVGKLYVSLFKVILVVLYGDLYLIAVFQTLGLRSLYFDSVFFVCAIVKIIVAIRLIVFYLLGVEDSVAHILSVAVIVLSLFVSLFQCLFIAAEILAVLLSIAVLAL